MGPPLWALLDAAVDDPPASDADLVADRRRVELFGLGFELCLIPGRAARAGIPSGARPAFPPSRADRIRDGEVFWRGDGIVATPNRFPFYWRQLLLWPEHGRRREAGTAFLERCFRIAGEAGGTLLVNTIGASASIPVAHAHLVERECRVLADIPMVDAGGGGGVRLRATDPAGAVPMLAVAVEAADPGRRARWTRRLLDLRATAAANVVAVGQSAFVVPRRVETPVPYFPCALGAGELSGRFVYVDPGTFARARSTDLEQGLRLATVAATEAEVAALRALDLPV